MKKKRKREKRLTMDTIDPSLLKLFKLYGLLEDALNKYPMTGKPDKEAAYQNGWYDCAYHIKQHMGENFKCRNIVKSWPKWKRDIQIGKIGAKNNSMTKVEDI